MGEGQKGANSEMLNTQQAWDGDSLLPPCLKTLLSNCMMGLSLNPMGIADQRSDPPP